MALEDVLIRRETVLPADRDAAWTAISDPRELERWLADEIELEIRAGAEGTLRWAGGEQRSAVVEEVEARRRVVLRWWERDGEESLVELTLDDVPDGTRLTVIELPAPVLRVAGAELEHAVELVRGPRMLATVAA